MEKKTVCVFYHAVMLVRSEMLRCGTTLTHIYKLCMSEPEEDK